MDKEGWSNEMLKIVQSLNSFHLQGSSQPFCKPFIIDGKKIGYIPPYVFKQLENFKDVFWVRAESVELSDLLKTPEERTSKINHVMETLRDQGALLSLKGWRNEAAGGIAAGDSIQHTLIKECQEEACIPESLARKAIPVGAVSYCYEDERGIFPEVEFIYDLELPEDFTPSIGDGEVQEFLCWPVEKVKETIVSGDFKPNCAIIILDFLIRHGVIQPDDDNSWLSVTALVSERIQEMNYADASRFRSHETLEEDIILFRSAEGYSPSEERISNKWNSFFMNSSGSETDIDSTDSSNKSVGASYASSSCSSASLEGLKIDDAQEEMFNTNNSDNNPAVKDISLVPDSPKRKSDGLCQITLSGIPSIRQNQINGKVKLGFSRQNHMEPSRLDDINENHSVTTRRHSHSTSSRLTVEDFDRMEELKISNSENGMLKSVKGTVRGYKNMVRRYSASFNSKGHVIPPAEQTTSDDDVNKIIIYTTSMTAVRATTDACSYVKKVFRNRGIPFEERDVFIHKEHQKELQRRLGKALTLPQVFISGSHIGGLKEIEDLNESGNLSALVSGFERSFNSQECQRCGGRRFINCLACGGSKTSRKHRIIREICSLRCTSCNENGLVLCPDCSVENK